MIIIYCYHMLQTYSRVCAKSKKGNKYLLDIYIVRFAEHIGAIVYVLCCM